MLVDKAEQQITAEFADGKRRAEGVPLPAGIEYEPISEALWRQAVKPAPITGSEPPWLRDVPVVDVDFETGIAIARTGQGFIHIREILDPLLHNQPLASESSATAARLSSGQRGGGTAAMRNVCRADGPEWLAPRQ
jgi:hypothetical protein